MERLHPHQRWSILVLRGLVVIGLAGCSNQQMSASNPFMAPDRVPPPATRSLAPGTAAPYYPGDPVPSAQNTAPAQPAVVQVPSPIAPISSAATQTAPQPLAFSNERNVAIPADNQDLRFVLPAPPTVEQPQPQPVKQIAATPSPAPGPQVIPAAFNQPVGNQPAAYQPGPATVPVPTATVDEGTSGPWRSPQVRPADSPVMQAQYVQPQSTQAYQSPVLAAQVPQPQPPLTAPTMPVELRAVPSPAVPTMAPPQQQVATTPPPRMRFPSWTDPASWFDSPAVPAENQQLIGYMVPGPNGQMQMVPLEQFQQMQAAAMSTAMQPGPVASSDGFRPRGSTK